MEENKILTPEMEEGEVNNEVVEEEESLSDRVKVVSPGRLVAKRFFRSRLSMIGLITLIVLFAFSFIGPIFSPWEETEVDYSIPEKKRENYLTTNYVEQLDPNDLFVNGDLFACNPLSGVDYDEDTGIGNYYRDGKQIWFKVEPGANKAVFVGDENGNKIMHYVMMNIQKYIHIQN